MLKYITRRPIAKTHNYLKFGLVITEHEYYFCPRCKNTLNAEPDYQPKCCDQCGQKIIFSGIEWKEDKEVGFAERRHNFEPLEN